MRITLSRDKVRIIIGLQFIAAIALAIMSMVAAYIWFVQGHDYAFGLVNQFYCDMEGNIPSWYSSQLILFNALILSCIGLFVAAPSGKNSRYWLFLAIVFVVLSIDEITSFHNSMTLPFRSLLQTSGFLYQAWVVPYLIFAAVVGALSIKFLASLPQKYRVIFILAGVLYVLAAVGMEILESPFEESNSIQTMQFAAIATSEEFMEMLAMTLFNFGLLDYLRNNLDTVTFSHTSE